MKYSRFSNDEIKQKLKKQKLKECTKCNEIKSVDLFGTHKKTSDGLTSWCNPCTAKEMQRIRINPEHKYQMLLKIEPLTDISLNLFHEIVNNPCHYCGDKNLTLGLDRIIPGKNGGKYMKNNVVSCCKKCNFMKREMPMEIFHGHLQKILNNLKNKS